MQEWYAWELVVYIFMCFMDQFEFGINKIDHWCSVGKGKSLSKRGILYTQNTMLRLMDKKTTQTKSTHTSMVPTLTKSTNNS